MLLNPITYYAPRSAKEAAELASTLSEAKILAGGTFVLNSLKLLKHKGLKTPKNIISLQAIKELKGVDCPSDTLTIKAMTTITDLFESPHLKDNFGVLKTVCRNISTNPIRNMATVGGNLTCRYTWTELGSALIALQAKMHFIDSLGNEEVISVEDFFKNSAKTNKILSHVTVERDKAASISYQRVKKSSDVDIPMLAVCIKTIFSGKKFTSTRVAINSWTTFAKRDATLEEFLNQSNAEEKTAVEALNHLDTTIYDTRSDDYKKAMFRVCIKNAVLELCRKAK